MAELSEIGRKLIDQAMDRDEPPPADESWGTLVSRLTEEAPRGALPVDDLTIADPEPASRKSWIWTVVVASVVVTGLIVWWFSIEQPEPPVVEPSQPDRPAIAVEPAKADPPEKAAPQEPPLEQLLIDAEAALQADDPDLAMALLQSHAERAAIHPQATRRMALRVLVLCAQDEQDQARDEARAFLAAHPRTPWSDAVHRSCAGTD
jgi:hypothetical protein